jgi:hypothetical protein
MSAMGKGRGRQERYVKLRHWLLKSQAWNSLSGNARALYVELAQRYNGSNNGRIPYSMRDGVTLHISHHTVSHLLGILQDRGFIVCTRKGYFSVKTTRDASEWRLTEYDCDHPVAHATALAIARGCRSRRPQPATVAPSKIQNTEAPTRPYGGPSETVRRPQRDRETQKPSEWWPPRDRKGQKCPLHGGPSETLTVTR